jgi:GTP cyclohydrolase I
MDPRAEAEAAYRRLIECLGEQEASRPELLKTPARAAKAWLELTSGIQVEDPLTAVGEGIFEVEGAQDLVAVRDMPFNSLCEHHLLPFWGSVSVAYIPNGRVLGLSKFARLLRVLARRLQLQERLAQQFAEALDKILAPQGVAIAIEARHSCMAMRGVATPAVTRTVALRGVMKDDPSIRALLLSGVSSSDQVAKL